jgi:hypothetical protein
MSRWSQNFKIFDAYLGVNQDTDNLAVADHLAEVILDRLLAEIIGPLLAGLGESLALARVPAISADCFVLAMKKRRNGNRPHRRDCPLEITVPCHGHRAPINST